MNCENREINVGSVIPTEYATHVILAYLSPAELALPTETFDARGRRLSYIEALEAELAAEGVGLFVSANGYLSKEANEYNEQLLEDHRNERGFYANIGHYTLRAVVARFPPDNHKA